MFLLLSVEPTRLMHGHPVGILWMVPIFATDSWLSLRFKDAAIYLDMVCVDPADWVFTRSISLNYRPATATRAT